MTSAGTCQRSEDGYHYVRPCIADERFWLCIVCLAVETERDFDAMAARPAGRYLGEDQTVVRRLARS